MTDDTASTDAPAEQEAPAEEEAPRDELREELLGRVTEALDDAVVESHIAAGLDLWVRVRTDAWELTAEVLRHRLGARYFTFLSAIDWMPSPFGRSMDSEVDRLLAEAEAAGEAVDDTPAGMEQGVAGGGSRFQVFARVASIGTPGQTWGLTVKADVPEDSMTVDSWTGVYAGADWHEREAWEMFGITFAGHPGLRHMYLPGDFEGNPLRKDFPLIARMVKPWPGIVDVEPMPTDDAEGGDSEGPAGSQASTDAGTGEGADA